MLNNNEEYRYSQISASGLVKTGSGQLGRIFVSTASATPTITVYDNTAGSGTKIIDTFTPTSGGMYTFQAAFATGCYVAIGGTVSCTVLFQ